MLDLEQTEKLIMDKCCNGKGGEWFKEQYDYAINDACDLEETLSDHVQTHIRWDFEHDIHWDSSEEKEKQRELSEMNLRTWKEQLRFIEMYYDKDYLRNPSDMGMIIGSLVNEGQFYRATDLLNLREVDTICWNIDIGVLDIPEEDEDAEEDKTLFLLPCPFCGSTARIHNGGFGEKFVMCDNPGCKAGLGSDCWQTTDETAQQAWNTRV